MKKVAIITSILTVLAVELISAIPLPLLFLLLWFLPGFIIIYYLLKKLSLEEIKKDPFENLFFILLFFFCSLLFGPFLFSSFVEVFDIKISPRKILRGLGFEKLSRVEFKFPISKK